VAAGTPLLFASLGEAVAERAGVVNLGLEGMMLLGAAGGFLVMNATRSAAVGVGAALGIGAAAAAAHGLFAITLKANQIVSGLALAIAGTGLSAIIGKSVEGVEPISTFHDEKVPGLRSIPGLGRIFFEQHALVYVGYVLVPLVWLVLARSRLGLHLRAVGENPAAADAVGVRVELYRYGAVVFGGSMAGLAGATLSLAESPGWTEGITAGRGWIALALVIFATWNPVRVLVGAYFFGCLDVLAFRAQLIGVDLDPTLLGMIPYVATFLVLVAITILGVRRRLGAPAALGTPYLRES